MNRTGSILWSSMVVFVAVTLSCSTTQASIIYSQDFSTDPRISGQDQNAFFPSGATGGEYNYEEWAWFNPITYNGVTDDLTLATHTNGATRGVGFALDGTGFLAGDYSFQFDVTAANSEGIGVGIYGMDFGGTDAYRIRTIIGAGDYLFVDPEDPSNDLTTLSADQMITGTGTKTINFTVDPGNAGDDLIFLFSARSGSSTPGLSTTIDDVVVSATAVPEPSSFALMGLGLAGFFWQRLRRKQKAILAIKKD